MKPYGNKCIVLIKKEYLKEKGKPVLMDGIPKYEIGQEGKVLSSNLDGIKKGMTVICNYRGGMPVIKAEDKKSVMVIFESEDIYAII
jgi:hypothetical protein